jgi:hypothetical protein
MKKEEISRIIESALKSGNKMPGMFDLPKIFALKSTLETCKSVDEVLAVLENSRELISKSFGLSEEAINSTVEKIKAL